MYAIDLGMSSVAKKISLTHAIRSMAALFPTEYDFYPRSWVLPSQLNEFKDHCAKNQSKNQCYIVKPDNGFFKGQSLQINQKYILGAQGNFTQL